MDLTGFSHKQPYGSELLTVSTTAKQLTTSLLDNTSAGATSQREHAFAGGHKASAVVIEVLTENVYYTFDGTTPSSTNGHKLNTGDVLPIMGYQKLKALKMVRQAAADSSVYVTYYNK